MRRYGQREVHTMSGIALCRRHELRTHPAGAEPNPRSHASVRHDGGLPFQDRTPGREIFQLRSASREVTADHSDAAKADDAVVIAKSSGLDIAKRHRRRQVSPPHVPSSPSRGRRNNTPPPPKPRGGLAALAGEKRSKPIRVRRPSAQAPSVQGRSRKSRRCCRRGPVSYNAAQRVAPALPRTTAAREQEP